MTGRFERLHRSPRQLTDSERVQITIAIAVILIALQMWFGQALGFGLGIVVGWGIATTDRWLARRGG